MAPLARADLESLLRARKLDCTLTAGLPDPAPTQDELVVAPTGLSLLDARLSGGFPRGQVSELIGPRSSGRTSLLLQTLRAAEARGELVALIDALDRFDVPSAAAAGLDLTRLFWVRGHVVSSPGLCCDSNQRALEQALKALTLILQAGHFGLVAFDVADAPPDAIRRLPFTTWLRLQRMIEGSQTTCVLVGAEHLARSAAGLTVELGRREWGVGSRDVALRTVVSRSSRTVASRFQNGWFEGLDLEARVVHARARVHEETAVALTTVVPECA